MTTRNDYGIFNHILVMCIQKYVFSRIWQTEWEYTQTKQALNIESS